MKKVNSLIIENTGVLLNSDIIKQNQNQLKELVDIVFGILRNTRATLESKEPEKQKEYEQKIKKLLTIMQTEMKEYIKEIYGEPTDVLYRTEYKVRRLLKECDYLQDVQREIDFCAEAFFTFNIVLFILDNWRLYWNKDVVYEVIYTIANDGCDLYVEDELYVFLKVALENTSEGRTV